MTETMVTGWTETIMCVICPLISAFLCESLTPRGESSDETLLTHTDVGHVFCYHSVGTS